MRQESPTRSGNRQQWLQVDLPFDGLVPVSGVRVGMQVTVG